jgi:hypothetical protein
MKLKSPAALALLLAATAVAPAQEKPTAKTPTQTTPPAATGSAVAAPAKAAISPVSTPAELARAAYAALGGDRYRDLKNLVLTGTVDLYAPNSTQVLPGKFGIITAGDKVRQEVQSPLFSFSLVSDGFISRSTMRGFQPPPSSKFGVNVLMKLGQPGYEVSALPDKKKDRAFRITEPDGQTTDFYIDAATGRLKRFEVPYGPYTYSVEIKSVKEIDGLAIPATFVQRISTEQGDFYAEFKVKDAKINQDLPEDTFKMPGQ